jgi:hypothetical protein
LGQKDASKAEFDKAAKLNKAVDEDLYKKLENGRNRPQPSDAQPTETQPKENAPEQTAK